MDVINSLIKAVDDRSYDETVEYIPKICKEVLGYEKIGECFPNDKNSLEDIIPMIEVSMRETIPQIIQETIGNLTPEISIDQITSRTVVVGIIPGEPRIKGHRCLHYGNSSIKNPEGVITTIN